MDVQLAQERLFTLEERMTLEEIKQRAMDRRLQAFGGGLGSIFQKPKAEEVVLLQSQRRIEPFWHISGRARYVYDRTRHYAITASAAEVREVTVNGSTYPVADTTHSFSVPVNEHCVEEAAREEYSDGVTGAPVVDGASLITGPRSEVADPETLSAQGTVVVPPEHRASFVVRKLLTELMKPVQADSVTEESLVLDFTDLYYRPIWAFEFHWTTRDRRGVVEIDGVTGQTRQAQSLAQGLKRMMTRDVLFDIGADTAGLLIPGGSIAVKVARAAIDRTTG